MTRNYIEAMAYLKLKFKVRHSFNIIPGQFIMVLPAQQDAVTGPIKWDEIKSKSLLVEPKPYLKRPFGIHRAFYRYFSEDKAYLQKLSLPPELAPVLHTLFPNKFEIFYKVLGIGTMELANLKKGDEIKITGPLGRRQDIREFRNEGFKEIHVIGGGVGMAPLTFIVQALQYYSYKVKAFIGTEKIEMLKYRPNKRHPDGLGPSFSEKLQDTTIYYDDLIEAGVKKEDIYLSSNEPKVVNKKIPERNLYDGFVSEQYKAYLEHVKSKNNILAIACGPMGMMEAINSITKDYGIPLKVLMEKRMACGIGVCLSCVCKTKTKTGERYSRVCTDGPIFDASEISW